VAAAVGAAAGAVVPPAGMSLCPPDTSSLSCAGGVPAWLGSFGALHLETPNRLVLPAAAASAPATTAADDDVFSRSALYSCVTASPASRRRAAAAAAPPLGRSAAPAVAAKRSAGADPCEAMESCLNKNCVSNTALLAQNGLSAPPAFTLAAGATACSQLAGDALLGAPCPADLVCAPQSCPPGSAAPNDSFVQLPDGTQCDCARTDLSSAYGWGAPPTPELFTLDYFQLTLCGAPAVAGQVKAAAPAAARRRRATDGWTTDASQVAVAGCTVTQKSATQLALLSGVRPLTLSMSDPSCTSQEIFPSTPSV